jgi:sulfur carrier protein ThiS
MVVYLRSGAALASYLKPDTGSHTRRYEVRGTPTLREILTMLGIPHGLVACAVVDGTYRRLDYTPDDNELITLLTPVAGG